MTEQEEMQRRVRRSALLLGLLALAFYVGYFLFQASRPAG